MRIGPRLVGGVPDEGNSTCEARRYVRLIWEAGYRWHTDNTGINRTSRGSGLDPVPSRTETQAPVRAVNLLNKWLLCPGFSLPVCQTGIIPPVGL